MKILLDTNFCLTLEKQAWTLEELEGNEVLITDFIEKEIKKVSAKNDLILKILENQGVEILETIYDEDNDEALIKTAQRIGAAILTNDLELRKKSSKKNVEIYYLRHKRKIQKG